VKCALIIDVNFIGTGQDDDVYLWPVLTGVICIDMQNALLFYLSTAHLHCQLGAICVVFLIAAARWLHLVPGMDVGRRALAECFSSLK
jgi:hypothetical protein